MRKAALFIVVGVLAHVALAGAQATRTWVSGVGDDANPCSRTAPCKTFAGAISKTAAGGEINVLDPGGFGGVTITKSISIISEKFEAGVLVSGTNAIIINALSTDVVVLRGLDIEGLGTGLVGIKVLGALQALHVENCTINNFRGSNGSGIDVAPTAATTMELYVTDTIIRRNGAGTGGGIFVHPGASANVKGVLNNVQMLNNTFGLRAEGRTTLAVKNSVATGNTFAGFAGEGTPIELTLDQSVASANGTIGFITNGDANTKGRIMASTFINNAGGNTLAQGTSSIVSAGNNFNGGPGPF
jgi:hypothetical protein